MRPEECTRNQTEGEVEMDYRFCFSTDPAEEWSLADGKSKVLHMWENLGSWGLEGLDSSLIIEPSGPWWTFSDSMVVWYLRERERERTDYGSIVFTMGPPLL